MTQLQLRLTTATLVKQLRRYPPAMSAKIKTEEGHLKLAGGDKLYTKTWIPRSALKARIVWLHGFSDHCNCYEDFFVHLASNSIKVYSFDQRGWGRSVTGPQQRGATGGTTQVIADIDEFIRSVLPKDDSPMFLGGHSMGGGEALTYACIGPAETLGRIRGVLLESPFLRLPEASRSNRATVAVGRLASKVFPQMQLVRKLEKSKLSRDPRVNTEWEDDPLCHDTGTLLGMAAMLDRGEGLISGRLKLHNTRNEGGKTRLWIGHGTADAVVDFGVVKAWFEAARVDDKTMVAYEGWYHKLHAEPGEDKVRFANDVTTWMLERVKPENRESKL